MLAYSIIPLVLSQDSMLTKIQMNTSMSTATFCLHWMISPSFPLSQELLTSSVSVQSTRVGEVHGVKCQHSEHVSQGSLGLPVLSRSPSHQMVLTYPGTPLPHLLAILLSILYVWLSRSTITVMRKSSQTLLPLHLRKYTQGHQTMLSYLMLLWPVHMLIQLTNLLSYFVLQLKMKRAMDLQHK
uniref:Uncharacterized protein n=1 Tax=Cacopsylla melanoneura TaxID=428564 RepID=A0A8D8RMT0_9HEMI